jgi:hypothetical protein
MNRKKEPLNIPFKFSEAWICQHTKSVSERIRAKRGIVVSESLDKGSYYVKIDGQKFAKSYHKSFIELLPNSEQGTETSNDV